MKPTWFSVLMIVVICEKIIQHVFVSLGFYFNWADIRSTVAVSPDVLMLLGGLAAVLFALALWGLLTRRTWITSLIIALALFDIFGEFAAQGRLAININFSFLFAVILLILALLYRRQRQPGIVEAG